MDAKKNRIGGWLREARLSERPKATQEEVSARLATMGVSLSASSIGKIENGTRPVTDIQLCALAKALKVTTAWLLGETAEKN
ncbi:helix-turn-helix domain-containing protein [Solibaculum intestinale]|uniref:Helix-turn-helix transcriptional regulator n=1 Tax=Solibaculum intestinale TaxID=3133165 RepID=A0ABV1DWS6_9FIRM